MRYQPVRQLFLLVLGAIVALGMGVSTVVSSDFAIHTTTMVGMMDDMAPGDCHNSSKGNLCESSMPCAVICLGPLLSLPPTGASLVHPPAGDSFVARAFRSLVGASLPPELSPPRTTYMA